MLTYMEHAPLFEPPLALPSNEIPHFSRFPSYDEHGIPIAVETISLPNRFLIGGKYPFPPSERRDQDEQGRGREVKIRDHSVNHAKPVPGNDIECTRPPRPV